MAGLSLSELYSLALSVGLTSARARVAAAVGMAESGGDPNAHNTAPPDDSYGLWQINMYGNLGPARRKQFGLRSDSDLYNPQTNARAMKAISSDGGNFHPWSVYTNGRYLKYMSGDVEDLTSKPGWLSTLGSVIGGPLGIANDLAGGAISGVRDIGGALELFARGSLWMSNPQNWVRVGYVVGGGIIAIAGLAMVMQSTGPGRAFKEMKQSATRTVVKTVITARTGGKGAGSSSVRKAST